MTCTETELCLRIKTDAVLCIRTSARNVIYVTLFCVCVYTQMDTLVFCRSVNISPPILTNVAIRAQNDFGLFDGIE